jgi:cbb3-type cytochrome oxidase subunit 3
MALAVLILVFLICIIAVAAFVFPPSKIVAMIRGEKKLK